MKPAELADEEIEAANIDELRDAYRELLTALRVLRAKISERTSVAVGKLRRSELKFNGNLPYGLEADDEKKLRASRYEKRLIAEIKKLYAAELPLRAIARTLTERNFVNRGGKPIDAKQVARILDAEGLRSKTITPE